VPVLVTCPFPSSCPCRCPHSAPQQETCLGGTNKSRPTSRRASGTSYRARQMSRMSRTRWLSEGQCGRFEPSRYQRTPQRPPRC
jgi:hypothetical protein